MEDAITEITAARCKSVRRSRPIDSRTEIIKAIRAGLPVQALEGVFEELSTVAGIQAEIYEVVGTARTLQRKRAQRAALSCGESDRLARLARLLVRSEQALGDPLKAIHWLSKPNRALGGQRPLSSRLNGGRWNSPGRPVVYSSSTPALAALEYLIHIDPADAPADLVALTIEIPDALPVQTVAVTSLPAGWAEATGSTACQDIGDAWLAAGALAVLRVPAAPSPEDSNVLVNPLHTATGNLATVAERPFTFDPRLLA